MPAKRPNISALGVERVKFWTVTAVTDITKQLTPETEFLFVDSVAACNVYLPPVGLMTGKTMHITNKSGTSTVTVNPFKEGATFGGAADSGLFDGAATAATKVLTAVANTYITLMSDGEKWIVMAKYLS